jgi:hypothetical protein
MEAATDLLRESGCTIRRWRASNTGRAATRSELWEIEVPEPRGPISFGVFAHEVGHQLLHRHGSLPRWREEVEAEEYALAQFDRFGLKGRERYEEHAALHLGWAFVKAIRRSKTVAAQIVEAYPEWYERAIRVHNEPSMSRERKRLDV